MIFPPIPKRNPLVIRKYEELRRDYGWAMPQAARSAALRTQPASRFSPCGRLPLSQGDSR